MSEQKRPAISVIIPVYKTEKYIRRCLDSVKNQTFADFEAIIINDGSPDGSAAIVREYLGDPRFKLYEQENRGVGAARNKGTELARGEYLAFVDSDDAVRPEHLEKLYAAARETGADIACCGYLCGGGKRERPAVIKKSAGVYNGGEMAKCVLRDISVRNYLWDKLWRKSLFTENGVTFPQIRYEDAAVCPLLFYYAKRVVCIPNRTYIYTRRGDGITQSLTDGSVEDYLSANSRAEEFFRRVPDSRQYRRDIGFQRIKAVTVAVSWLFIKAYRAEPRELIAADLRKIAKYAAPPKNGTRSKADERRS